MTWLDKIIYARDFAYPTPRNRRLRMANTNIGDAPAPTLAEYVPSSNSYFPTVATEKLSESAVTVMPAPGPEPSDSGSESDGDGGARAARRRSSKHSRPTLAHRIYTKNLRVQASAKSLRARLLSGPLVDIYVGEERRHWSLHRNLLCHHSEQLSLELLPSRENKSPELRLELPDDDPAGFELLVKWLYQGKLEDVSDIVDPYEKFDYAMSLHKLYLLCDRFDLPQLKNLAMDQFRKGLHEAELVPDASEINDIYRKSPEGSPFRLLMVKIAARQIMDPATEKDAGTYRTCMDDNPSFAIELINAIRSGSGGILFDDPTDEGDKCSYHDHNDDPGHITGAKEKQGNSSSDSTNISPSQRLPFISNFRKPPTPPESPIEDDHLTQQTTSAHQQDSDTITSPDHDTTSNTTNTSTPTPPSPHLLHSSSWAQIEPDHRLMAGISPARERDMGSSVASSNGKRSGGWVTASGSQHSNSSWGQGGSWQEFGGEDGDGRSGVDRGGGQRGSGGSGGDGGDGNNEESEGGRGIAEDGTTGKRQSTLPTPADTPTGTPRRNAHPPKLRRKTGEGSPAVGGAGAVDGVKK